MKTLTTPLSELTQSHTGSINGIVELGQTTQLVTISEDMQFCIWEATTGSLLTKENLGVRPTSIVASDDGNKIFIGSEGGVIRIYDVCNRCLPRLVKMHKFFDTEITKISISHDQRIAAAMSRGNKEICFFYQGEKNEFEFMCYARMQATVQDICWNTTNKELRLIGITQNSLLFSLRVMVGGVENIREPIKDDTCFPMYTKIDSGSYMISSDPESGDIYVANEDRHLKKYPMPNDTYEQIDWGKPADAPAEEFKSHGIRTTCIDFSNEANFIASGGKDGVIILRNRNKLNQSSEIKSHAVFTGGISAICFSKQRTTLYSAGGDGSFLAWSVGQKPNPMQAIEPEDIFSSQELSSIPQMENNYDHAVKYFKDLLEEQFLDSEVPRKDEFKKYLSKELESLQSKLYELLEDNKQAQDIEQLEREEFVIDVKKKERIEKEAEEERERIRKEAKRKELELECLRDRVKNNTWDTMKTHSTACVSLDSDLLLYNYGIRDKTKFENRRLKQILHFRRMELREQISAADGKLADILDHKMFSTQKETFLMNRFPGEQYYEQDESVPPPTTTVKSPSKRKKEKKKEQETTDGTTTKGKRKPKVNLNQFRLGANKPKDLDDDEFADKMKDRGANRDEAAIDQLKWKILTKRKELEELRKDLNQLTVWDLVYEPFELYTDARKRMQIDIIHEIVFKLKEEYNKEFTEFQKLKDDQIFIIQEKNNRIKEILEDLETTDTLFEPKSHKLETPESILTVEPEEIKVEKYLTAEERAIEEEKRRIEEERLKALEGDNVGQRGIKMMLGGTLEIKKNKGLMQETLEREEWMNKPLEDMTEEEKLKLKEFEQKEKELQEEKEKKRKAWDQELRKLKIEIEEICFKFEDQLRILHKKRLFYDMRIYEQELYIIRLTLMLHENNEIKEEKVIAEKKDKIEAELEEARFQITRFTEMYDDFDNKFREGNAVNEQEKQLKQRFPNQNRAILNFVRNGGRSAQRTTTIGQNNQNSSREQEMMAQLNDLDPYILVDKNAITKIVKEENDRETYTYERDNFQNLSPEEFDAIVEERMNRVEINKQKSNMEEEINHIKEHKSFCEFNAVELEEAYQEIKDSHDEILNRMTKLKYNFEVVLYLLQGQVEVPQAPVATDYKDAILIKTKVIENENSEVVGRGNKNVEKLEKIINDKKKLSHEKWRNDKLLLEIKDLTERAIDVQLYKVKKETQEIIKGNNRNKDEDEKKRIESQIKQFEDNASTRIKTINEKKRKLKKEIKDKKQENVQLEMRARQLQQNVDKRKQIMELRSKGADDNVQDPDKKFKQIFFIRKYKEIVEQQKEEIEFLEDELERHRSRTFPSFANMHSRQDYAD